MPGIKTFQCPNCGSPITTTGAEKEITCAYCGSAVIVPKELRDAPQPQPQPQPMQWNFPANQPYNPPPQNMVTADNVAKATIGFTAVSFILPIVLTCVILAAVGGILFYVFSNVNSTINQANQALSTAAAPINVLPTSTPVPTATSVPTPPIPTPVPFSKVLLQDNFTNPSSGRWSRTKSQDYTEEYKNGYYHILILPPNPGRIVWTGANYTNVSVEVDVKETTGANDATMGVACRASDNGWYSFEFDQNGDYGIYKSGSDGNSNTLAEGTLNPNTITQNDTNHVEGVCDGDTLTMIVNNQVLLQVQDSTYTKGGVGMVVTSGSSGSDGMDVLFSNFLVKGP